MWHNEEGDRWAVDVKDPGVHLRWTGMFYVSWYCKFVNILHITNKRQQYQLLEPINVAYIESNE
jgi:hypothetical protein